METLQEQPPAPAAPTHYPPAHRWNSETARRAARKSNERQNELRKIGKALQRHCPIPDTPARLTHLRRMQRQALAQGSASTSPAQMLEAAKAAREFFEMEMELLGRREGKAGRGASNAKEPVKPAAPSVQLPQE